MPIVSSRSWRWVVAAVLPAVAGCASLGTRQESPAERYLHLRDSIDAVVAARGDEMAPGIRLFVRPNYPQLSSYIDVDVGTDDDGYALVLAVDYDNHVRVLYPAAPTETGAISARDNPELRSIFAGFGQVMGDPRYRFLRGGVVVALASARPFQLQRIMTERGAWDEAAIARLLDRTTVMQGADELGRALTMVGQDYSYDYSTFKTPSARTLALASRSSMFANCSSGLSTLYYGALPDPNGFDALDMPLVRYVQIGGQLYAQYLLGSGGCGRYSAPVPVGPRLLPPPKAPNDTTVHDSTKTPAATLRLRDGPRVITEWSRDGVDRRTGAAYDAGSGVRTVRMRRPVDDGLRVRGWTAAARPEPRQVQPATPAPQSRPEATPRAEPARPVESRPVHQR